MRLSCNAHCLYGRPLLDALAVIREIGYEAVEVNWPQVERCLASTGSRADAFKAMLNETGLIVSAMCVADMNAVDESEIELVCSVIERQIAVAGSLQAGAVVVRGGDRRQQPFEILSTGLRPLLAQSGASGISLLVANARDSSIEQVEDLRQLCMEVDEPGLGLALDSGQFHDAAVNPCDVLREFADCVRVIRLGDRIARRCVPLGQGEMNVPAVIERARRSGYDGWLVVEPDVRDALEAQQYLADARSYLSTLLSDRR